MKVTKKEIIKFLVEKHEMSNNKAKEVLNDIIDFISNSLKNEGDKVLLKGFGVFKVIHKPAVEKKIFNKLTKIPERNVIKFYQSKRGNK